VPILTTIQARTTPGSEAYNIGGQPVALILWSNGQTVLNAIEDGWRMLIGFSDGTDQRSRSVAVEDSLASPKGSMCESPVSIYKMAAVVASGAAAAVQEAQLTSFDASGFTLDWLTTNGEATEIHVLAFVTGEITDAKIVSVFNNAKPQAVTGVGFRPDCVFTISGVTTDNLGFSGGPYALFQSLGVSDAVNQYVEMAWARLQDNVNPVQAHIQHISGEANLVTSIFQGFTAVSFAVQSLDADGFTINKNGFGATSLYHHFLAIKGATVKVGRVRQPASAGTVSLGIPFEASAILFQSCGSQHDGSGENLKGHFAMGAWTPTEARSTSIAADRPSGITHTARETRTADVLRLLVASATGSASTVGCVLEIEDNGATANFSTCDGIRRFVNFVAFLTGVATPPASCSDGTVPTVADPPDGPVFDGLGPHYDRFFTETDLDDGTVRYAMHQPMNDRGDLAVHPGRKEGLLLAADSIIRRTTDRLGGWQTSTCRFLYDDHQRKIRALIASGQWFNRETRPYLAKRDNVENALALGRFIIREYPLGSPFNVEVNGVDIIGTDFSPFSLDRDITAGAVFDGVHFPDAPTELLKMDPPKPIPALGGVWSDEASDVEPPILIGNAAIGSAAPDGMWTMGFGNLTEGPEAPAGLAAVVSSGGTITSAVLPYGRLFAQVWAVDGAGVAGDPYPFLPNGLPITLSGTGQKVTLTVTPSGGPTPDKYRFALATDYFGPRWLQILEVPGGTTSVVFDAHPALIAGSGAGAMTAGAFAPILERRRYIVVALIDGARTGASDTCRAYENTPYYRPIHVTNIPVIGATGYEVYATQALQFTDGSPLHAAPPEIFNRKWSVPVQLDADGYQYFEDRFDDLGVEFVDGATVPSGMLPVTYAGDETIDGVVYGRLVLSRWPCHLIIGVYAGGKRLADNHPDLLHQDHPAWPFAEPFRTVGGLDLTIIYARQGSAVLLSHLDGTAPVQVNACTTEDVGDGSGSTITQAARLVQHFLTELVFNDHHTGLWAGIPLFADGVAMIRTSSYASAETMQIARVGGTGYTGRIAIIEPTTLRTFIERVVHSFGLHHGINRHGQVVCGHYDDAIDTTLGYPHFRDVREIVGRINVVPRTNELENYIPYVDDFRPVTNDFKIKSYVSDATAIAANRDRTSKGSERTLAYSANVVTSADVMQRALLIGRYVQQWVEVPTSIVGQRGTCDLFSVIRVTDAEGLGADGYQEAFILILEHETQPPDPGSNRPILTVLKGLNITALADAACVWGPDTLTDWDSMSDEERGIYGAYAADDDTIPSDNSPAKEWR
jgi:hypothetical protein